MFQIEQRRLTAPLFIVPLLDDQTLKQYLLKDKASPACSLTSDCLQFNFTLRLSLDCHRSFSAQQ
jgi:hypothetical protein